MIQLAGAIATYITSMRIDVGHNGNIIGRFGVKYIQVYTTACTRLSKLLSAIIYESK